MNKTDINEFNCILLFVQSHDFEQLNFTAIGLKV